MVVAFLLLLLFCFLGFGFIKAIEWFQNNKNINIIPATLIDVFAIIIFLWNYDGDHTKNLILMYTAIAVILIIIVFNLLSYGLKDGLLVSFAELIFSIPAALLIVLILVAGSQKGNKKRKK